MKKLGNISTSLFGIALLSSLTGCGGTDATGTTANLVGNYVEPPPSAHHTILKILSNGSVTGTSDNFQVGGNDNLTGTLSPNGSFMGRVTNDVNANFQFDVSGTIKFGTTTNQILVNYSGSYTGTPITTDIHLMRSGT